MLQKKSFGNGKINDDALSAVEINCSFGCESVLRRETEGISESKSKIAPLFIKKGYPNRKGKGKLSIKKNQILSWCPWRLHWMSTKELKWRVLPSTVFCMSEAAELESVWIGRRKWFLTKSELTRFSQPPRSRIVFSLLNHVCFPLKEISVVIATDLLLKELLSSERFLLEGSCTVVAIANALISFVLLFVVVSLVLSDNQPLFRRYQYWYQVCARVYQGKTMICFCFCIDDHFFRSSSMLVRVFRIWYVGLNFHCKNVGSLNFVLNCHSFDF